MTDKAPPTRHELEIESLLDIHEKGGGAGVHFAPLLHEEPVSRIGQRLSGKRKLLHVILRSASATRRDAMVNGGVGIRHGHGCTPYWRARGP